MVRFSNVVLDPLTRIKREGDSNRIHENRRKVAELEREENTWKQANVIICTCKAVTWMLRQSVC